MKTAKEIIQGYLTGYMIAYLIIAGYSLYVFPEIFHEVSAANMALSFPGLFVGLPLVCIFLGIFAYPAILSILIIPIVAIVVIIKKNFDRKRLFTSMIIAAAYLSAFQLWPLVSALN